MNRGAFFRAFTYTMQHEGGFSHDPDDPGGMTYMGISREYNPTWIGWGIIDALPKNAALSDNESLTGIVRAFYVTEYWDRLQGDFVASLSENVAVELFDTAVNLGRRRAIEIMQQALNLLNRNELLYPNMVVDGLLGGRTRSALAHCIEQGKHEALLVKVMNHIQAEYYINLMRKYPSREKFVGWFART